MPGPFTPVNMSDGSGVPLDANFFNTREAVLFALSRGIDAVVDIDYAAAITPNASQARLFRCIATGDITLNPPTGGSDGQTITVVVTASGGSRTLSFGASADSTVIPSGGRWIGRLTYSVATDEWVLDD